MAEQITRKYQGLFAINLLHHYWLDEGIVAFDLIPDSEKKEKRSILS